MLKLDDIQGSYLHQLVDFLSTFAWIFESSNTQYVKLKVLQKNEKFLNLINFDELLDLKSTESDLNKFINQINSFKIYYEVIQTDSWTFKNSQNKLSVKKLYEIENIGELIKDECSNLDVLIDLGSGLGYLDEFLHVKFNFKVIGIEGCEKIHLKAIERQEKYYPKSSGLVKHVHHFVTIDSGDFIMSEAEKISKESKIALFGLHPCGDLSVISIKLFLNNDQLKTLIISPCCYHKMSAIDSEFKNFHHFPLSRELKEIFKCHTSNPFLRSFLRLAGQQSPEKIIAMSLQEHFKNGKRMFERAVIEAILDDSEVTKRIDSAINPHERLKFDDLKIKYKIYDKATKDEIQWSQSHEDKFNEIRHELPRGEEQSEILQFLQSSIQNCCENLIIVDRIFYIKEQAEVKNLKLKINVKKLQNEKLSPRCHVFVIKKF